MEYPTILVCSLIVVALLHLVSSSVPPSESAYLFYEMTRGFLVIFVSVMSVGSAIQQLDWNEPFVLGIFIALFTFGYSLLVGYYVVGTLCKSTNHFSVVLQSLKTVFAYMIVYFVVIRTNFLRRPFEELLDGSDFREDARLIPIAFWVGATALPAVASLYLNIVSYACSTVSNKDIHKITQSDLPSALDLQTQH